MKAIVFDRIGSPVEVLHLRDVPVPRIGPGQVLVRLRSASINPGDFLFIQALYPDPKKPVLPQQIAGQHGAGVIVESGPGVAFAPGTLVAFSYQDVWAEYVVVPVEWLIPLPSDYPLEKASQIVNLVTAWDLLEQSKVEPGRWLALTAGHSAVATMVSQMARARGVNVVSIVRRTQPHVDLKAWGASAVIDLSVQPDVGAQIAEITRGQGLSALLDSAGGPLAGDLVRSLRWAGRAILYGGYSAERFSLHNFDILIKDVQIAAYVYRFFFDPPRKSDRTMLDAIVKLTAPSTFEVRSGGTHTLDDFETAVRETWERPERGKRFFVETSP